MTFRRWIVTSVVLVLAVSWSKCRSASLRQSPVLLAKPKSNVEPKVLVPVEKKSEREEETFKPGKQPDAAEVHKLKTEKNRPRAKIFARKSESRIRGAKSVPKKDGKKYALKYSGDRFIREEKRHPATGKKEVVITILGRARIQRGDNVISAPKIEIIGEDSRLAIAPHRVQLRDFGQNIVLKADYGEYRKYERRIFAKGHAEITKRDKQGKTLKIFADEMERKLALQQSFFEGNIVVHTEDLNVYANSGIFYEKENRVVLLGDVRVFYRENIYLGDKVTLRNNGEQIDFEKNVRFILMTEKDSEKKVDAIVTGDSAKLLSEKKGKNGKVLRKQQLYMYSSLNGQKVRVRYENATVTARELEMLGSDYEFLKARDDIFFQDTKQQVMGYCDEMEYQKPIRFLKLNALSGGHSKDPILMHYDETSLKVLMRAKVITRDAIAGVSTGKGEAQVRLYEKTPLPSTREDALALPYETKIDGEWAEYKAETGYLTMTGNVRLSEKTGVLRGQRLAMEVDSGKIRLQGGLHGRFKFGPSLNR